MIITPQVNTITSKVTPFFSSTPRALSVGIYFIFAFQDLQNSVSWGPPFALCSGLQKTHFHAKDNTFKPVNMDILFLHKSLLTFGIYHVLFPI